MRVVRIQSRICVGGPALHCILLSEGLSYRAGSRYDTTLVSGALEEGEASVEDVAQARGVPITTVSEMKRVVRPSADAAAVAEVVRILRQVRPHIVHTHTAKAGAIGRTAARIAGVPIVLHTFHGHVFDGYFSPTKTSVFIQVERALARMTDQILAISEQQRVDLVERYRIAPAHKVSVVPLGLDLERFRVVRPRAEPVGTLRRELGLPSAAKLVLTVGRLVPIKRFDLLIEAFRAVQAKVPEAHLVIVGDGECRDELKVRAAGHPHIHFTGLRRDLPAIYADADLMALSSDNEGTPVAVIEALSSGVAVVATNVGGVSDILGEGMGQVVPPGNVSALKDALQEGLLNPQTLSDSQRNEVLSRYSHVRLIRDIEGLYDGLVAKRDRARFWGPIEALRKV